MPEQFERTEMLLGKEAVKKLKASRVAVFGVGGVGGYVCEALVRSGVGEIDIIDSDTVDITNLNRQIIALHSTLGMKKTEAVKRRMLDIAPDVKVNVHDCFFLPETSAAFDFRLYDYVVDAVDTVTAKIEIVMRAIEAGVPVISSMGTGNKLDPSMLTITDLYKTSVCPLAKVMRRELKKRGVKKLKVLYSQEIPLSPEYEPDDADDVKNAEQGFMEYGTEDAGKTGAYEMKNSEPDTAGNKPGDEPLEDETAKNEAAPSPRKRAVPGSWSVVPPCAGLMIAGAVIRDLAAV